MPLNYVICAYSSLPVHLRGLYECLCSSLDWRMGRLMECKIKWYFYILFRFSGFQVWKSDRILFFYTWLEATGKSILYGLCNVMSVHVQCIFVSWTRSWVLPNLVMKNSWNCHRILLCSKCMQEPCILLWQAGDHCFIFCRPNGYLRCCKKVTTESHSYLVKEHYRKLPDRHLNDPHVFTWLNSVILCLLQILRSQN